MVKTCNQLLVGSNLMAIAEAMVLAERSGLVSAATMREAVTRGFPPPPGPRPADGRRHLPAGFKTELHAKDARIVEQMAAQTGTSIAGFDVALTTSRSKPAAANSTIQPVIEVVREQSGAEGSRADTGGLAESAPQPAATR